MASAKVHSIMTQPIIWLFKQKDLRIEGRIIGFDEYMNLVLDDAWEVNIKKTRKPSGGYDHGLYYESNIFTSHWANLLKMMFSGGPE